MAVETLWYTMDNKSGVDLNYPFTSVDSAAAPNPTVPAAPANKGDRVQGNNGSEWIFVQASATVTAKNLIAINNVGNCANLTSALVISNVYTYGIAMFQATQANATDFFWALVKANFGAALNVDATSSVAGVGAALYISAGNPGQVMVTATTNRLNGIFGVNSVSSGATIEIGMFSYILPGALVSALPIA